MLYEESTMGLVVYGVMLDIGYDRAVEDVAALNTLVAEMNREHKTNLTLVVPGDSSIDSGGQDIIYSSVVLLGVIALEAWAGQDPVALTEKHIFDAASSLDAVPGAFWSDLAEASEFVSAGTSSEHAKLYLTCCGPLPYAALAVGRPHPSDERDSTEYQFFSVQDMYQEWGPEGVDGKRIETVEFTDAATLSLDREQIAKWKAQVSSFTDPKIYMTVRYD